MFLMTLMTKSRPLTSCSQMCLTATLHSRPSVSEKIPLHGSLRPSKQRWTDVIGSSGSITATHQLEHGTSSRPKGIVLFGFKGKPKMEYFHQPLCKKSHPSHIWNTLKLATASSAPPENWPSFNSNNPSSIANTLNSHFTSVSSSILNPDHTPLPTPSLPHPTPTLSLHPATPEWCENALAALKPNCATGPDQLAFAALIAGRTVISYPLCSIINSSIARSVFPTPWKCAIVKPLHNADCASPTNYRPISLLPVPSKVLEKHVHIQLSQYLHTHNLLYPLQSGFCPSHST